MVKNLLLVRHAEASKPVYGQKDHERELTHDGYRNAVIMGRFLNNQHVRPDIIMTSTAIRARNTARLVGEQLQMEQRKIQMNEELYESSVRIMLVQIKGLHDHFKQVIMVGHNPTITYLAEYLSGEALGDIHPAGVVKLGIDSESWTHIDPGNTWLSFYEFPESVKKKGV